MAKYIHKWNREMWYDQVLANESHFIQGLFTELGIFPKWPTQVERFLKTIRTDPTKAIPHIYDGDLIVEFKTHQELDAHAELLAEKDQKRFLECLPVIRALDRAFRLNGYPRWHYQDCPFENQTRMFSHSRKDPPKPLKQSALDTKLAPISW